MGTFVSSQVACCVVPRFFVSFQCIQEADKSRRKKFDKMKHDTLLPRLSVLGCLSKKEDLAVSFLCESGRVPWVHVISTNGTSFNATHSVIREKFRCFETES
jgi:hypothetical protein